MYKFASFCCILAFLALPVVYGDVKYEDCGSQIGKVASVKVSGCDGGPRCNLHRDTNATVEISFTSEADVDAVKAIVHGVVLDVPVPFPIPNSDACVDSGLKCPIKNGESYVYVATLPVLKKYPRMTVGVQWALENSKDEKIVCIIIPSKIV